MREKDCLVLDIGTEAVKIGFSGKTAIRYYDKFGVFDGFNFEQDVIKKAVLKALEDLGKPLSKSVFLALPPDVLRVRISYQSLSIKGSKKDISEEILRKNRREVSKSFLKESGILPQELEFLGQSFLERKIDGYRVLSFERYQGKEAQAQILSVFSTKEDLKNYQKILGELGLKVLRIIHPVQELTKVFKDKDGVFLDVGGEITQIFIVRDGNLREISSFPMGGRDFTRLLSETFGLSEERARILKERYSQGKMTEATRRRFNEIFADLAKEWCRSFRSRPGQKFFLFGGGALLPEISEVLEEKLEILKNPQEVNLTLLSYYATKTF